MEDPTYPTDLPVLSFIKAEGSQSRWRELHERQLQNPEQGELVQLDGGHYLHWTHYAEVAQEVTEFLSAVAADR